MKLVQEASEDAASPEFSVRTSPHAVACAV